MEYSQRRKEQARHTEEAILRAAVDLLRQERFDRVSVRDICRAAGITTGAFYHHFKSKDELLRRGFSPLDSYMEQALAPHEGEPPVRRLQVLLTSYTAFMEHMGWELLAQYYQQRLSAPDSRSMDESRFTLRAMLACLREADAAGTLAGGITPEWAADFLFRHFRGAVIDWILHQGSYSLSEKLEQDCRLFQGLFQGPG